MQIPHLIGLNLRRAGTGCNLQMKQVVTLGRPTWQGTEDGPRQQPGEKLGTLSLTTERKLNPSYSHMSLGADPSPVERWDETTAQWIPQLLPPESLEQRTQLSHAQTLDPQNCEIINVHCLKVLSLLLFVTQQ